MTTRYVHTLLFSCPNCKLPIAFTHITKDGSLESVDGEQQKLICHHYISGHSAFSAAGAEILKLFTHSDKFGDSVTFGQGSSNTEPGLTPKHELTLSWATFTDAANQAGISRRYGGIHFELADLVGRATGRKVADQAWEKALTFIKGKGEDADSFQDKDDED